MDFLIIDIKMRLLLPLHFVLKQHLLRKAEGMCPMMP